ncbi:MAG: adenylyltransferase/cytidyltransferase family protein [Gemmatimonadales bacterium]
MRDSASKIRPLADAVAWRRAEVGRVVFTNGVFELLHPGHVASLEAARDLGDRLVVGVNGDASARALGKGPGRPATTARERARVLAALEAVDCVVIFDEPTPLALIEALGPDVLVKGGDYSRATVVGADLVEARGGEVVILPLLPDTSTTGIVERIRDTR